jgi:putative restriction endonuclease
LALARAPRPTCTARQAPVGLAAKPALKEYGPLRQPYRPEYPFWRLQNDGVWVVRAAGPLVCRKGQTDAKKSELLAKDATGGFSPEVQAALRANPGLASEIAGRLLEGHFPESIHPDNLAAVGLSLGTDKAARRSVTRSSGSGC